MTTPIDCHYLDAPGVAAAYLLQEGDEAAFVETNTSRAAPALLAALDAAGLSPEAVRWIVVTHIHLDHAGGAGTLMAACPNATLLAHPRAAPHAIDPSRLIRSAQGVYGEARFAELYGEILPIPEDRVRVMDDEQTLRWGRRTWTFLHTRGHANHHFAIHDDIEDAVFTGDAFGIGYPGVQAGGRWVFPSTSPTDFDAEAGIASAHRIANTGARTAWLTHFGAHRDLPGIAVELERDLARYGELLDEVDQAGLEGEALDRVVAERVDRWFAEALDARGLGGDATAAALVSIDRELNAQGIVAALQKRRYKRGRSSRSS